MEVKSEPKAAKRAKSLAVAERTTAVPEAREPQVEAIQVEDSSEEERKFQERYLSAEKESLPDWRKEMDAAKTKEERFGVGLKVGDLKTSYAILAEELLSSFVDGDKERLDKFLTKVGMASWQLALIQVVVIGVPVAGVTYALGL